MTFGFNARNVRANPDIVNWRSANASNFVEVPNMAARALPICASRNTFSHERPTIAIRTLPALA